MQTIKFYFLVVLFFLITHFTYSQEQGLNTIVQEDLKEHLIFIASDSLQGRTFGTEVPGLEITAEYIKTNIQKFGLIPGTGNYFQPVEMVSVTPDLDNTFMKIFNQKGKQKFKTKSVISLAGIQNSVKLKGEIVVAGFGTLDEKAKYDDFEGLSLKDKIVVYSEGNCDWFKSSELRQGNNREETAKMNRPINDGAKAVILVTTPKDRNNSTFNQLSHRIARNRYSLKEDIEADKTDNFFMATPDFADALMGGKGKYYKYLSSIAKNGMPNSYEIEDKEIEISIQKITDSFQSKNVIGYVEGSDPVLKNEYLFFMAHYDHLGIAENGDVYNGADDNASGSSVLLELAEAFNSLSKKPKRSVVFLWVTGEELGMFGSDWYTEYPVFPLEKTVACINLDMVGRVFEPRDTVWKKSPKMVKDFDGLFTLTNDVWPELKQISDSVCNILNLIPDNSLPSYFLRSSDHYHFHKNKIPVLNVATGYHADYHKPSDEVSKINFDKMKRVADFCFLVGMEVANSEENILKR